MMKISASFPHGMDALGLGANIGSLNSRARQQCTICLTSVSVMQNI